MRWRGNREAGRLRPRPVTTRRGRLSEYLGVADLLLRQGRYRFRVGSDSMLPALRPGALLHLEPASYDQLAEGDLVAARVGETLVCHRLIRSYTDRQGVRWLVTKGDRSPEEDAPVRAEHGIGRVVSVSHPPLWNLMLWRIKTRAARVLARWRARRAAG